MTQNQTPTPAPRKKFTKAERRILRALKDNPWATIADLHKVCELDRIYIGRLAKALIEAGIIDRRMSLPTYALSEAGQQLLDSMDKA